MLDAARARLGDPETERRTRAEAVEVAAQRDGMAAVIDHLAAASDRVRLLTPELVKGLEFDLVVLLDPASYGVGITGAVDRYVAMTRATQRLVVLTPALPGGTPCPRPDHGT